MRKESVGGAGVVAAISVLLLGVAPIFYFLSLGPAVCLANSGLLDEDSAEVFYTPLIWLADSCRPAEVAIQTYVELWDRPSAAATMQCPPPMTLPVPVSPAVPSPPVDTSYLPSGVLETVVPSAATRNPK